MTFKLTEPCTYLLALEEACEYLDQSEVWFGHGTDNSWDESVTLLLWAAGLAVDTDNSILEQVLPSEVSQRFEQAINTRVDDRKPAAYITRQGWFCGLPFYVNESVLVPRSPIAELISNNYQPWAQRTPKSILDLCCGSGCIGIAAAIFSPESRVVLSDLSNEAIDIARRNIESHQCGDRVQAIQSDLFEALENQQFDLILSNPPYVNLQDISSMPVEYHHEPEIGLGSGDDGLDITRKILASAANHLTDDGVLVLEVGNSWVHLEEVYPRFPFIWIEFANGGLGVCVLTKAELLQLNAW